MKKILLFAASAALVALVAAPASAQRANRAQQAAQNTLTAEEQQAGWKLLFDGESFDGWRKYNGTAMPEQWSIDKKQGAMKLATNAARPGSMSGADIIFADGQFSDFELSIDWMIEEKGNSGILYYVAEVAGAPMYQAAPEIQVLDNWNASDTKLANHLAGSLYDMLPALPQNAKPAMQWNTIVIRIEDGRVTHTQNGVEVCRYSIWTPEWGMLVADSKFRNWPGFNAGPAKQGYIGLQDHGYAVWFRNIKIRELK
jgi:type II secretory pathway pseudopilin PulG